MEAGAFLVSLTGPYSWTHVRHRGVRQVIAWWLDELCLPRLHSLRVKAGSYSLDTAEGAGGIFQIVTNFLVKCLIILFTFSSGGKMSLFYLVCSGRVERRKRNVPYFYFLLSSGLLPFFKAPISYVIICSEILVIKITLQVGQVMSCDWSNCSLPARKWQLGLWIIL